MFLCKLLGGQHDPIFNLVPLHYFIKFFAEFVCYIENIY